MKNCVKKSFVLLLVIISLALSCPVALASSEFKVIYKNQNLIQNDNEIEKIAEKKDEKNSKFSIKEIDNKKLYYEDGKVYRMKSSDLKEATQKIQTLKDDNNTTIDEYVSDCIGTLYIENITLTEEQIADLGLQGVDSTTLSPEATAALLQFSNEAWSSSYALKIRYTVYYNKFSNSVGDFYAFCYSYGKVVSSDTGSGIYPTSGEFYVNLYGKGYNSSTGQYLGTQSYSDSSTISSPAIGTAYYFDLGPDNIYYQITSAHLCGTTWTVYASRGVSAFVSFNP